MLSSAGFSNVGILRTFEPPSGQGDNFSEAADRSVFAASKAKQNKKQAYRVEAGQLPHKVNPVGKLCSTSL